MSNFPQIKFLCEKGADRTCLEHDYRCVWKAADSEHFLNVLLSSSPPRWSAVWSRQWTGWWTIWWQTWSPPWALSFLWVERLQSQVRNESVQCSSSVGGLYFPPFTFICFSVCFPQQILIFLHQQITLWWNSHRTSICQITVSPHKGGATSLCLGRHLPCRVSVCTPFITEKQKLLRRSYLLFLNSYVKSFLTNRNFSVHLHVHSTTAAYVMFLKAPSWALSCFHDTFYLQDPFFRMYILFYCFADDILIFLSLNITTVKHLLTLK